MKKFIFKIIFSAGILALLVWLISTTYQGVGDKNQSYMAAIIDKHHRCDSVPAPRIIFVGGSNLAFGIDSDTIEQVLKTPVINLGLHAGLGLEFMLNEALDIIQKGDVLILSPEYFLDKHGQYDLLSYTASVFPHSKKYFTTSFFSFIKLSYSNFQKKINTVLKISFVRGTATPEYSRSAFNTYGDVVKHLDHEHHRDLKNRFDFKNKPIKDIDILNNFVDEAEQKGVLVYYMFPVCPETDYASNREYISNYYHALKRELHCELLGNPEEFVLPDTMFYDTVYHLLRKGRSIRTQKIIQHLQRAINEGQ